MKKLLFVCISAMLLVLLSFAAVSAAPESLPANVSTSGNLITVTNPPSFSTTTQKGVVFCGYGQSGTKLYFYEYNSSSNTYKPIISEGEHVSLTINSSGVFWKKINFNSGYHKVVVYAETNSQSQSVKREINVITPDIVDKIKGFSVNVNGLIKKGI